MTAFELLGHLVNFCLPAVWMAAAAVLCGGLLAPARGAGWPRRLACNIAVGLAVLLLGWLVLGSDGKMATWMALVAAVALSECLLRGAWKS
ncbi:hypothetical protein GN316_08215 [Xylophilus sp. Kf1]|nr:hypothetical protein [Xylophilus sp. Kf1]